LRTFCLGAFLAAVRATGLEAPFEACVRTLTGLAAGFVCFRTLAVLAFADFLVVDVRAAFFTGLLGFFVGIWAFPPRSFRKARDYTDAGQPVQGRGGAHTSF